MRLQRDRRRERLTKLTCLLQKHGLIPEGDVSSASLRDRYWKEIDRLIFNAPRGDIPAAHTWLYRLFARGLTEKLQPIELGRVLYHAAHLRGFKSNRKDTARKGEDHGVVKEGIRQTRALVADLNTEHVVAAFSRLDPEIKGQRTRSSA